MKSGLHVLVVQSSESLKIIRKALTPPCSPHRPTPEQRAALLAAIKDRRAINRRISPDFVSSRMTFFLPKGSIAMVEAHPDSAQRTELVLFCFTSLEFKFCEIPGVHGFTSDITLASLKVTDRYNRASNFPVLVGPKQGEVVPGSAVDSDVVSAFSEISSPMLSGRSDPASDSVDAPPMMDPFFAASYSYKIVEGTRKLGLQIRFQPLEIVLNKQLALHTSSLFTVPSIAPQPGSHAGTTQSAAPAPVARRDRDYSINLKLDIRAPKVIFLHLVNCPIIIYGLASCPLSVLWHHSPCS